MKFVKPNILNGPSTAVGQDDRFANKLDLSLTEFGKDCARSCFRCWHWLLHTAVFAPKRQIGRSPIGPTRRSFGLSVAECGEPMERPRLVTS